MRSTVAMMVMTFAVLLFSGNHNVAEAQITVTAPTNRVVDVHLTHVGVNNENACVLQVKVDSTDTKDTWRLFRLNEADDNAALIFCMSRLLGDCVTTIGETTTEIAVGGYIVEAQVITGYTTQEQSECE